MRKIYLIALLLSVRVFVSAQFAQPVTFSDTVHMNHNATGGARPAPGQVWVCTDTTGAGYWASVIPGPISAGTVSADTFHLRVPNPINTGVPVVWNPADSNLHTNSVGYWGLTGNPGTNPAVNFLGTTDNEDFYIKRSGLPFFGLIGSINEDDVVLYDSLGNPFFDGAYVPSQGLDVVMGDVNSNYNGTLFHLIDWKKELFFTSDSSDFSSNVNIYGSLKLQDGTQGADKVLTSDASGNASWQPAVINGATGSEPGTPYLGQFYFDTTLVKMKFWNGATWAVITSTP